MNQDTNNSTQIHSRIARLNLKGGLRTWAKNNNIRPSDFARAMGYTPAYAWSLLRGNASVTIPAIGLFLLTYVAKEAKELLALAGIWGVEDDQSHPENSLNQNDTEENKTG